MLTREAFSFIDETMESAVEKGTFTLRVADKTAQYEIV